MISNATDSGGGLGWLVRRHVTGCASCRQFRRDCSLIGARLRTEATDLRRSYRQSTRRILAAAPQQARRRRLGVITAVAACLAVAGVAGLLRSVTQPQPPVSAPQTMAPAGMNLPTAWLSRFAETRNLASVLTTEARNIAGDAESGLRFLVACLDVSPVAARTAVRPGEVETAPVR